MKFPLCVLLTLMVIGAVSAAKLPAVTEDPEYDTDVGYSGEPDDGNIEPESESNSVSGEHKDSEKSHEHSGNTQEEEETGHTDTSGEENSKENANEEDNSKKSKEEDSKKSKEDSKKSKEEDSKKSKEEDSKKSKEDSKKSKEKDSKKSKEEDSNKSKEEDSKKSKEEDSKKSKEEDSKKSKEEDSKKSKEDSKKSKEEDSKKSKEEDSEKSKEEDKSNKSNDEDKEESEEKSGSKEHTSSEEPTTSTEHPATGKPTKPTEHHTTGKPTKPTQGPKTDKPTQPTEHPTTVKPTRPPTQRPKTDKPTQPTEHPTTGKPTKPPTHRPKTDKPTEPTTAVPTPHVTTNMPQTNGTDNFTDATDNTTQTTNVTTPAAAKTTPSVTSPETTAASHTTPHNTTSSAPTETTSHRPTRPRETTTPKTTETTTMELTTRGRPGNTWGPWSSWSNCSAALCQTGYQYRYRRCGPTGVGRFVPCTGPSREARECTRTEVNAIDCEECELFRGVGYLSSCSSKHEFYKCSLLPDDSFSLTVIECAACTVWSQELLTCVRDEDDYYCTDDSQTGSGDTSLIQVIGERCSVIGSTYTAYLGIVQGDPTRYKVYTPGQEFTMPCPAGTLFNLTQCACAHAQISSEVTEPPVAVPDHCVTFESMMTWHKWGFMESGTWHGNNGKYGEHVKPSTAGCRVGSKCGQFDSSYLSIDSLANSFHTWSTFTINLWFKSALSSSHMGILTNGLPSCNSLPSVSMTTRAGYVTAVVYTSAGSAAVVGRSNPGQWTNVRLVRDTQSVSLYINGLLEQRTPLSGSLRPSNCPMIFGMDAHLNYFTGYMDQICLYREAVYPTPPPPEILH